MSLGVMVLESSGMGVMVMMIMMDDDGESVGVQEILVCRSLCIRS